MPYTWKLTKEERSLVRKREHDHQMRCNKFIAYWKKRVTPERLQEKLKNEFGEHFL